MIMYVMGGHKYLDTMRYPCMRCKGSFRGTNAESLALDADGVVRGDFDIRLTPKCAVDEALFDYIETVIMKPMGY
jgi:hypothetical protein